MQVKKKGTELTQYMDKPFGLLLDDFSGFEVLCRCPMFASGLAAGRSVMDLIHGNPRQVLGVRHGRIFSSSATTIYPGLLPWMPLVDMGWMIMGPDQSCWQILRTRA